MLTVLQLQYAYQLTQFVQLFLVKTSVVLFYRRIFCSHNKFTVFNVLTKATLVIIFLWSLVFLIATVFQCDLHVDAAWLDGATYLKECPGVDTKNIAISVSDFIIDLWIITMPIPPVSSSIPLGLLFSLRSDLFLISQTWGLHLDLKRKIAVSAVFLLGLVAVAASLTRMVTNIIAVYSLNLSVDPDLFITSTMYWGMFESGMALFAACLPSLRFLFGHMSPDALIRSIRSMLSLESLRSNGSSSRRQRTNSEAGSNASDVAITKPETILGVGGNNNHTYIASDSEIGRDSNIQLGQIYVKKGFQTEKTKV